MGNSNITTTKLNWADTDLQLATKKILIIDDEPSSAELVSAFLESGGYQHIRCENDSRNGIVAIREFAPDMILLDIGMPHVDGLELLEKISGEPDFNEIIVLMLSAAGKTEEQRSYELGALGFLPKPNTVQQVIRIVSSTFRIANRFGPK